MLSDTALLSRFKKEMILKASELSVDVIESDSILNGGR